MASKTTRRKRRLIRRVIYSFLWGMLIVLAIALLTLLAALLFAEEKPPAEPLITATPAPKLEIDPNAGALITPVPKPTAPGVSIPGWGSLTIPAGVTEVQTAIKNPEANEGWYYLTFQLRLKETNEVLFTTGLIPPGQYCNKVVFNRAMEPGKYAAIVRVQPYRISDQSPTNNADLAITLIVE